MALCLPISWHKDRPISSLSSFCPAPLWTDRPAVRISHNRRSFRRLSISAPRSAMKIVRCPVLDRHVEKQKKIRFVQKLKTLLLSKPKHFMPLHIIWKCRSYLSLPKHRTVRSMINRYPTIFEFFAIPLPPTPLNAAKSGLQVCVRLTPAAAALAAQELKLKLAISTTLAAKLQKLLMLSTHRRILLTKLVHLVPDLGLPPNFRSRLCNDFPERFKIVDTSYGRALELVSWDSDLATVFPSLRCNEPPGLIVDRPLRFKLLRLRKGLNLKRRHRDSLIRFRDLTEVCPYKTQPGEFSRVSIEAEKRACAVVREVLAMMVEKRTLVDHLTHFRKDFELPNRLHSMLVRHPDLFYVSVKGDRDSVFLVEAFGDKGELVAKDEGSVFKQQLLRLVQQGKRLRRAERLGYLDGPCDGKHVSVCDDDGINRDMDDDCIDGFEDLFACEDFIVNDEDEDDDRDEGLGEEGKFWTASQLECENERQLSSW